jgi:hypothetical protein
VHGGCDPGGRPSARFGPRSRPSGGRVDQHREKNSSRLLKTSGSGFIKAVRCDYFHVFDSVLLGISMRGEDHRADKVPSPGALGSCVRLPPGRFT